MARTLFFATALLFLLSGSASATQMHSAGGAEMFSAKSKLGIQAWNGVLWESDHPNASWGSGSLSGGLSDMMPDGLGRHLEWPPPHWGLLELIAGRLGSAGRIDWAAFLESLRRHHGHHDETDPGSDPAIVPQPATGPMVGLGLFGIALHRRHRRDT